MSREDYEEEQVVFYCGIDNFDISCAVVWSCLSSSGVINQCFGSRVRVLKPEERDLHVERFGFVRYVSPTGMSLSASCILILYQSSWGRVYKKRGGAGRHEPSLCLVEGANVAPLFRAAATDGLGVGINVCCNTMDMTVVYILAM